MFNKKIIKVVEIQNLMHNFHTLPNNYWVKFPSLLIKPCNESIKVFNEY